MRVLVTGASGQVGTDLVDALEGRVPAGGASTALLGGPPVGDGEFAVTAASHGQLAVDDAAAVAAAFEAARPDVVVHLGAYTAVDRAETEPDLAHTVNAIGTANVAAAAERVGAHLVYTSTDYVFDGTKPTAYLEDDAPSPRSVYGRTKLEGELACMSGATIARVSWVAGYHGRNIVRLAADRAQRGEPMRFVDDQRGCPSFAADLAGGLVTLVRERPRGLVHLTNAGATTWFGLVRAVAEAAGGDPSSVTAIPTSALEPPPLAPRPTNSELAPGRLVADGYDLLPPWEEAMHRLVAAILEGTGSVDR
ncbi:MAG TPA: dTDP-4-dehydrorhamnose reductase [Acidimicrobiales bacterium]|jgi:dTDP-4-dehydrorhamnose reductase|nr:dTDP-4-dehydrorhamnose reductase [Acidimicrobiales bacterium]